MKIPLFILASQSKRRKEILGYFNIHFKQVSPNFDESSVIFDKDIKTYIQSLSKGKANSIKSKFPNIPIMAADTIVYFNGKIYGKPKGTEHAIKQLSELVGNCHSVYTGITIELNDQEYFEMEETKVYFHKLTMKQIKIYLQNIHFEDKAGGYAIQKTGSIIVKKIDGCYYNVMGLPIKATRRLLLNFNLDLWDFLK